MEIKNEFINAEIRVSNKHEAEMALTKARRLGYNPNGDFVNYRSHRKYFALQNNGYYGFRCYRTKSVPINPLSDFLNLPEPDKNPPPLPEKKRTQIITLENGEKWRVQLIEKVEEEPITKTITLEDLMEGYVKFWLEFERKKQQQ